MKLIFLIILSLALIFLPGYVVPWPYWLGILPINFAVGYATGLEFTKRQ